MHQLQASQVHSHLESVVLELTSPLLLLLLEMPSGHQDLHRALLPTLLRVRDLPLHSSLQKSS
jgi:hypothetical protein